jgi:RNA polymerase sigma-70 factor (ECF subfamily)
MQAHHALVFRRVVAILCHEHDAHDVTQEVWLTVWRELPKFRGYAAFTTWLCPIATRRALDHLRKRQRWFNRFLPFTRSADDGQTETTFEPIDPTVDPAQHLRQVERRQLLEAALAALPPLHRTVPTLRETEGLRYEDIAHTLDLPIGTVMSRLYHARRLLAQKLKDLSCD